ncbi:TraS protein [Salmonella enterica]|uniref:TraS protein n=1 Tax=Salmonella typhimurium TaxID=90371 RepID=A0A734G6B8_SALTM|nr:TraS protein [Salmonella enterica subsp. enterica serovar Kentucky]EDZ2142628.1 TraS protein [Salmonella enterica]EEB5360788.1 TraS protein [Salmonella enterica subsp. enterica serovar Kentucky]EEN3339912.1 TraS protein [Salmonella enterica subsp. enterica serovar Kentucky]HAE6228113.1 TraS protein [Salmonella enterica subsp. enterica serovar Typhimurium]
MLFTSFSGSLVSRIPGAVQEFIFAECCSDEIANIILEAVKRYTSTEPAHATQH